MLAEGVLTGIAYRYETYKSPDRQRLKMVGGDSWQDELIASDASRDFHPDAERQGTERLAVASCAKETEQEVHQARPAQILPTEGHSSTSPSPPLCTPRREQYCEKLDLYRSWLGQSFYQNYPDLHIGGGHIVDHTCDSGCIMDKACAELSNSPVLLSEDFPSSQATPLNHFQKAKPWNGDEAVERSLTAHREPLSNSMINVYMEVKVQELYNQFLEEELTRCSSLTHILTSNLLISNVGEASPQLPRNPHTEASKATRALWHSLARLSFQNASHGSSDEFSTPNLLISKLPLERKSSVAQHA